MTKQQEEQELLKFKIDQLRKDKMIYAIESIAITFIMELGYVLFIILFGTKFSVFFALIALVIPLGYFAFMIIGNLIRLRKILELEKKLYKK